jgi:hypothetical protein
MVQVSKHNIYVYKINERLEHINKHIPYIAESSHSIQKIGRGTPYKYQKVKIIYNDLLRVQTKMRAV